MANRSPATAESTHLTLANQQAGTSQNDDESDAGKEVEAEVEKLEEEVKDMAHKLSSYRSTFPDQLRSGLAALLAAQRPQFPVMDRDSEPASASGIGQDAGDGSHSESSEGVRTTEEDEETSERIRLLKEKISSNISAMPLVLKRMNDCISRIDKLSSHTETIYPAFKRKKS